MCSTTDDDIRSAVAEFMPGFSKSLRCVMMLMAGTLLASAVVEDVQSSSAFVAMKPTVRARAISPLISGECAKLADGRAVATGVLPAALALAALIAGRWRRSGVTMRAVRREPRKGKRIPLALPAQFGTFETEHQQLNGTAMERRTLLSCAGLAAPVLPSAAANAKFDWLSVRRVDPMAKEWWGTGGTMSAEEVQKAASSLTPLQRYVLLEGGVEDDTDGRAFANGYSWDNRETGVYVSAISGVPLFSSDAKIDDDRLGWPGFVAPIDPKKIVLRPDPRDGISREVLDRASMTHLGHIVDDVDDTEHYCINAASLRFIPKASSR